MKNENNWFVWYCSWYPPGHGDFYDTFRASGLLKKFIDEGREYCFLSNIDNLGATVDLNILNKLVGVERSDKPVEFVMEVTDKTRADVKVSEYNIASREYRICVNKLLYCCCFENTLGWYFNTNGR